MTIRTPLAVEFQYRTRGPEANLTLLMSLYDERGVLILTAAPPRDRPLPSGSYIDRCIIPGDLLNNGLHRIGFHLFENGNREVARDDHLLSFELHDAADYRGTWYERWRGAVRPALEWTTERAAGSPPPLTGSPAVR